MQIRRAARTKHAADPGSAVRPLELFLLGPFDARVRGRPLPPLHSRKGRWLLALLALRSGRETDREWLAGTLWPDSAPSQGFYNLRENLSELRAALEDQASRLRAPTRRSLSLDLAGAFVDLVAFEEALSRGDETSLEQAAALYRGPLLEGCVEEWVLPERETYQQRYLHALRQLAHRAVARSEPAAAVAYLRRAAAVDPLQESIQRELMEALAADGDFAAATQTYRDLRLLLYRELNAAPAPETSTLFERLRGEARRKAGEWTPGAAAPWKPGSPPAASALPRLHPSTLPPVHLPRPLTRLVGREAEAQAIQDCLATTRLVTLTGTGGIGKTRLAIEVSGRMAADYPDGVWFVDLAPLTEPGQTAASVARTLGMRVVGVSAGGRPIEEPLVEYLEPRRLLLVLDNCEHLAAAPAHLASTLLERCPEVRILATSRHPLRLPGEVAWRVPGLAVPKADAGDWFLGSRDAPSLAAAQPQSPDPLPQYPGVELFLERARAARREFQVAGQSAAMVAGICRRLDGIPLAIELAAAHVRSLPLEQIAARLDDRFRLLTGGSPAPPRHETLRAAMDWSYHLLTEPERALLRFLAVFVGGFSFEAAERVGEGGAPAWPGGSGPPPGIAPPPSPFRSSDRVDDALSSLVDKSLVLFEEGAAPGRYRLPETVRQYAWERLEEGGEVEAARERHGRYFLDQLEGWQPALGTPAWFHYLAAESPNVMAALEWALARPGQGDRACRLGAGLNPFWARYGSAPEGGRWWERALSSRPPLPPSARVVALRGAALMALCQGDRERAQRFSEASIAAARELRDPNLVAGGLLAAGSVAGVAGEAMSARSCFAEALALSGGGLESRDAAQAHLGLGWVCHSQGDLDPADAHAQLALAGFQRLGDAQGTADALHLGGLVLRERGFRDAARARLEQSLGIRREFGDLVGIGWALNDLGDLARAAGDAPRARALFEESLTIRRAIGDRLGTAGTIGEFGYLALDAGNLVDAEARFEESLAIRRAIGEREGTARMLLHLGALRQLAGDRAAASRLLAESLEVACEVGHRQLVARALTSLAMLELRLGHREPAAQRLLEALPRWQQLGDARGLAWTLEGMAELALEQDDGAEGAERAAALMGAAAALREAAGGSPPLLEHRGYQPPVETARARLGEPAFAAAWAAGQAAPPDQVATHAFADPSMSKSKRQ